MARDTCYFDGVCGMCQRTRKVLSALDWLDAIEWVDFTTLSPEQMPVPIDQAMRGMPLRTADGRVLVGFPAVRRAILRTPVGFLPGVVLLMPGVAWIAGRVYDRVAASRTRACAASPAVEQAKVRAA